MIPKMYLKVNNDNLTSILMSQLGDISKSWYQEFTKELKSFKEHIYNDTLYSEMNTPFFES